MARRAEETPAADDSGAEGVALADFAAVLRYLRGLAEPCAPPVGVGTFDLLCASERHILVWYSPAREGQEARECVIPTPALAAAWGALRAGERLDEAALVAFGQGAAGGRWLLALLAQLPGVRVESGAAEDMEGEENAPLTLRMLAAARMDENGSGAACPSGSPARAPAARADEVV
jgi:hypothetical protein